MLTSAWHRSSKSDNGNCVEARRTGPVQVRDSHDSDGAVLTFDPRHWSAFIVWVKQDLPSR